VEQADEEMAKHPNVSCKLSGLFTETTWKEWSASDFYPYLDVVFDAFGTERLMFGSDWPVMLLSVFMCNGKVYWRKYMENFTEDDAKKYLEKMRLNFFIVKKMWSKATQLINEFPTPV
jgi:L-fuconolactonase